MATKKDDPMEVWNRISTTNPKHTKAFDRGAFKGTAISPQFRWMMLTEAFGPAGKGWGVSETKASNIVLDQTNEIMVNVQVSGWYLDGNEKHMTPPGFGQEYLVRQTRHGAKSDDEAYKKAFTDALSNAFKYVGLSADVYMGMYDDDKYVNTLVDKFSEKPVEPQGEADPNPAPSPKGKPENAPDEATVAPAEWPEIPEGREHLMKVDGERVVCLPQEDDVSSTDLADLVAWWMPQIKKPDALIDFVSSNAAVLDGTTTSDGMHPADQGGFDWVVSVTEKLTKVDSLNKSWARISSKFNSLKKTQPNLYNGVIRGFKQRKEDLK